MDFLLSVTLPAGPFALSCSLHIPLMCVTEQPDESPQPGLMRIVSVGKFGKVQKSIKGCKFM